MKRNLHDPIRPCFLSFWKQGTSAVTSENAHQIQWNQSSTFFGTSGTLNSQISEFSFFVILSMLKCV